MKAVIEIELELDGEWKDSDKETLMDAILEHPDHGGWTIDEDRLAVFDCGRTLRLVGRWKK